MAWRDYTDPNTLQTWSTDNEGNFLQGSLEELGLTRSAPINQMPGSADSYTAQPAATSVSNVTGPSGESLDQMRRELAQASGSSSWYSASPSDVLAKYTSLRNAATGGGSSLDAYNAYQQAMHQTNREQFDAMIRQQEQVLAFDKQKWAESFGLDKEKWAQQYALDQAKLTEMTRQFNAQLGETGRQFDLSLAQQQAQSRAQFGLGAMQVAGNLRGPEDYASYVQNSQMGRSLYNALYGSQPVAAFGAPTGYSAPASIETLLRDLGMLSGGGGAPQQTVALQNVPLPHQINPVVWNSLSDTAKKMTLSLAGKGYTEAGAIPEPDYLKQLEASFPLGQAPRRVAYDWQQPQSYFG